MIWFFNQRGDSNDFILEHASSDSIVIISDTEWFWKIDENFLNKLYDKGIKKVTFVFSSFTHSFYKNYYRHDKVKIEIVNWNTFWFNWAEMCLNATVDHKSYFPSKFKYPFINLNNKSHRHRCALIDNISEQGLLEKGVVSWNRFLNVNEEYKFKHYDNSYRNLDNFLKIQDSFHLCQEYHESFLHVIGEATDEVPFITEKTVIPILLKKPFVVLSLPNYSKYLQDLGFQLYDEIIDYQFDKIEDLDLRAKALVTNLHNILNQDLNHLYDKLYPKLLYNYNRALEIIQDVNYIPKIIQYRVKFLTNPKEKYYDVDGRYHHFMK